MTPNSSMAAGNVTAGSRVDTPAKIVRATVTLLFLGGLVNYIDRLVITLALPFIGQAFFLNKAEQGLILTVFFITYGVVQIPGGLLVDWIGARKSMMVALVGWSIFTALTAVAFNYSVLLVIRTLFGVCEGIYPAAFRKAVVERTTPEQRLTVNGFHRVLEWLRRGCGPAHCRPGDRIYRLAPFLLSDCCTRHHDGCCVSILPPAAAASLRRPARLGSV